MSEKNIKVHNWFFEITLTWAFDATTIEFVGFSIGIGAAIVGTFVFEKYKNDLKKIIKIYFNSAVGEIGDKKIFKKGNELVGYVHGYKVIFRGYIEEEIFKVGTAYIPFDFILEKL